MPGVFFYVPGVNLQKIPLAGFGNGQEEASLGIRLFYRIAYFVNFPLVVLLPLDKAFLMVRLRQMVYNAAPAVCGHFNTLKFGYHN